MSGALRGPRKLFLLHVSDIHLRKEEIESTQDVDEDIRAKLAHDIGRAGLPPGTVIDAVLVTGDVAFGGDEVEYRNSRQWLKTLCSKIKCPESQIWVVPGNHDKDRDVITESAMIRDMHAAIRAAGEPAHALAERLRDAAAASALLSPFAEYNKFAEQFQNETTPKSVHWESRDAEDDLVLNDGSYLRLRGINSSIISDKSGDRGPPKGPATEVSGLMQVQLRDEEEGICYLTMCHHPPEWHLDGDDIADYLTTRARIQLFGHKHRQRVRRVDNSIVLGAGALHPNRGETGWEPRYNIITVEIRNDGDKRWLRVGVYQRVWKPADTDFGKHTDSDDEYPKTFDLPLSPWTPPRPGPRPEPGGQVAPASPAAEHGTKEAKISTRELVFQLFALPYPTRIRIFLDLYLVDDGDTGISDSEQVKRAIMRAKERSILEQLEGAIRSFTKAKE